MTPLLAGSGARATAWHAASLDQSSVPALAELGIKTVFIAGDREPASGHTERWLARYRTGGECRVSHLKRRYGLDRSRLKGDEAEQIWTEWAILAYNTDTLAVRTRWSTLERVLDKSNPLTRDGRARSLRGRFVARGFFGGK